MINMNCTKASPDGINIKRDNDRYGRLLEVKIQSRELSGTPKLEYWVQMQHHGCCIYMNVIL